MGYASQALKQMLLTGQFLLHMHRGDLIASRFVEIARDRVRSKNIRPDASDFIINSSRQGAISNGQTQSAIIPKPISQFGIYITCEL